MSLHHKFYISCSDVRTFSKLPDGTWVTGWIDALRTASGSDSTPLIYGKSFYPVPTQVAMVELKVSPYACYTFSLEC